jgi:hypothetical protein
MDSLAFVALDDQALFGYAPGWKDGMPHQVAKPYSLHESGTDLPLDWLYHRLGENPWQTGRVMN